MRRKATDPFPRTRPTRHGASPHPRSPRPARPRPLVLADATADVQEGCIDEEDIFCSRCGLFEPTGEDDDIILCDGSCDRAYHQRCEPPPIPQIEIMNARGNDKGGAPGQAATRAA